MSRYFGVAIREGKYGLKLTRESYAIISNKNSLSPFSSIQYADEKGEFYTNEWCTKHLEDCLMNYDLNIRFFSQLDPHEYNNEIDNFLKVNSGFKQVEDLNLYNKKAGYYLMILDEYHQIYIGTSDNIKKRILQHWSIRKPFDRLLCPIGAVGTSMLSIDSFRAYDTTRIYACINQDTYEKEDYYINQFSSKFLCNRLSGGKITGGLLQALTMLKKRELK